LNSIGGTLISRKTKKLVIFLILLSLFTHSLNARVSESVSIYHIVDLPSESSGVIVEQAPPLFRILQVDNSYSTYVLDPYRSQVQTNLRIYSMIYNTLIEYDVENKVMSPKLATDWFISSDSLHWTFTLRENVLFSNGDQFNASHVKFTFERLFDPDNSAYLNPDNRPISTNLDTDLSPYIDNIVIDSTFQITFNLKSPFSPFLSIITGYFILNSNAFENGSLSFQIGTGPYMHNLDQSDEMVDIYDRNNLYFEGIPPFEHIESYAIEPYSAINEGLVDFMSFNSNTEESKNLQKSTSTDNTYFLLTLNFDNPIIQNPIVREAFELLIDQKQFLDIHTQGWGVSDLGSSASDIFFRDNQYTKVSNDTHHNVERAAELLDQAGYPIVDGSRFTLDYAGVISFEWIGDLLSLWFNSVNIQVNTTNYQALDRQNELVAGNFDIAVNGVVQSGNLDPAEFGLLIRSEGDLNFGSYSNNDVDQLFELAEQTPVRQERSFYYRALLNLLSDERPILSLSHTKGRYQISPEFDIYVYFNHDSGFTFNYAASNANQLTLSQNSTSENTVVSQFGMSNYGIYFWKQNAVIETIDNKPLLVTITTSTMIGSSDASTLLDISVNDENVNYLLSIYYDKVDNQKGITVTQSGASLSSQILNQDSDLQFVQFEITGSVSLEINQSIGTSVSGPFDDTELSDTGDETVLITILAIFFAFFLFLVLLAKVKSIKRSDGKMAGFWQCYPIFIPQLRKYILIFAILTAGMLFTWAYLSFYFGGTL